MAEPLTVRVRPTWRPTRAHFRSDGALVVWAVPLFARGLRAIVARCGWRATLAGLWRFYVTG